MGVMYRIPFHSNNVSRNRKNGDGRVDTNYRCFVKLRHSLHMRTILRHVF